MDWFSEDENLKEILAAIQRHASTRYRHRVFIARGVAEELNGEKYRANNNLPIRKRTTRTTLGQLHSKFMTSPGSSIGGISRSSDSAYLASIVSAAYLPIGDATPNLVLPLAAKTSMETLWRAMPKEVDISGSMVVAEASYLDFRSAVAELLLPLGSDNPLPGVAQVLAAQEWAADVARFGRRLERPKSQLDRVTAHLKRARHRVGSSTLGDPLARNSSSRGAASDRTLLGAPVSPVTAGGYHSMSMKSMDSLFDSSSSRRPASPDHSEAGTLQSAPSLFSKSSETTRSDVTGKTTLRSEANEPKGELCLDYWGFSAGLCALSEQLTERFVSLFDTLGVLAIALISRVLMM